MLNKRKLLLCILDGWGYSAHKENNAIYLANTPCIDDLQQNHPNSLIKTSGKSVGLPKGQMGNSEVGHLTIGAGRVLQQSLLRLNELTNNPQALSNNPALAKIIKTDKTKCCHILGMISDGGVHSHIDQIINLAKFLLQHGFNVKLHAITDGRDTPPKSAIQYVQKILDAGIEIASISGRYYAMDRDKRWTRVELAYNAIIGKSERRFRDIKGYLNQNYDEDITDEFIIPAHYEEYCGFQDGDSLLVANFRADRTRQILDALFTNDFIHFQTTKLNPSGLVGLVEYSADLSEIMNAVLEQYKIKNDLGEYLSNSGLKQLRIAETEKYAHVTYFFNCGREKLMESEEWVLIPSLKVKTYDLNPEMSAYQITDELIALCQKNAYDFVCVNYANADMIGHTGNLKATIKACEAIDECIARLVRFCEQNDFDMLITADHGNAEEMMGDVTEQVKTSHTTNDVPLIYFGNQQIKLKNGELADIAPTALDLMGLSKPTEMTGVTLAIKT